MKKTLSQRLHSIPNAFVFLLIGLFAVSSLTLTLIGTRVYRNVTDSAAQNSDSQIVLSYLRNKVRAFDAEDCVRLDEREGLPLLCLYETLSGQRYETSIYAYQGGIWERFAPEGEPFDPNDGERLIDAQSLQWTLLTDHLLEATVVFSDGETSTVRMALRTGAAKEAG